MLRPERLVSIDLHEPPREPFYAYLKEHGLEDRILPCIRVDQADRAAVVGIIESDLAGGLDLVIDDGSHFYDLTKASFNIVFPYLKPGGLYIIEDWAWAHWSSFDPAALGGIPLTKLVFEIIATAGGSREVIDQIIVDQSFVAIRRGNAALSTDFDIGCSYVGVES